MKNEALELEEETTRPFEVGDKANYDGLESLAPPIVKNEASELEDVEIQPQIMINIPQISNK